MQSWIGHSLCYFEHPFSCVWKGIRERSLYVQYIIMYKQACIRTIWNSCFRPLVNFELRAILGQHIQKLPQADIFLRPAPSLLTRKKRFLDTQKNAQRKELHVINIWFHFQLGGIFGEYELVIMIYKKKMNEIYMGNPCLCFKKLLLFN